MPRPDQPQPDDSGGVEFIVGAGESGTDEELPQPRELSSTTRSRLRLSLVVLAALGVLAAVLVRAVSSGDSNPVAKPSPSPSPSPSLRASAPDAVVVSDIPVDVGPVSQGPIVIRDGASKGPSACPQADDGLPLCSSFFTVSPPVLAALRSQFPGARVSTVIDKQLRDIGFGAGGVWYRAIRATQGSTAISIVVRIARSSDLAQHNSLQNGTRTTITVQRVTSGFTVSVSATAATVHLPSFLAITALASDRRLVARRP